MNLLPFALAAMHYLAPNRDHAELASALVHVVEREPPLFADDADKRRTLSFAIAVAFRESSLRNDAVGDDGRARCAFQLWHAPKEVLTDPVLCTSIAFARMRESMRACGPHNPLGIYASGPKGCTSERAKKISRDRLWLAKRIRAAASAAIEGKPA